MNEGKSWFCLSADFTYKNSIILVQDKLSRLYIIQKMFKTYLLLVLLLLVGGIAAQTLELTTEQLKDSALLV